MRVVASSGVSAIALKAGHVHATARAERERKDEVSPQGLASEA